MKEFRRSRRREVTDTVHVVDCMTERVIGHISNLSDSGMLMMATAPLVLDALYQLRFELGAGSEKHGFEIGGHLLWADQANAPGQAWAGFRFIAVSEEAITRLRRWIDAPGSRYV